MKIMGLSGKFWWWLAGLRTGDPSMQNSKRHPSIAGWWFGTIFSILGIITPTDFHILRKVGQPPTIYNFQIGSQNLGTLGNPMIACKWMFFSSTYGTLIACFELFQSMSISFWTMSPYLFIKRHMSKRKHLDSKLRMHQQKNGHD
jgi:hypothetical protein